MSSNITGCDYSCQRAKNINQLKAKYSSAVYNYQQVYQKYLTLKYDKSSSSAQSAKMAQALLSKLKGAEQKVNTILNALKKNNIDTDTLIAKQRDLINTKTKEILEKNIYIKEQDVLVNKSHNELLSKTGQNQFSLQRNRYRRVMLTVLVLINLLVIGLFIYLVSRR